MLKVSFKPNFYKTKTQYPIGVFKPLPFNALKGDIFQKSNVNFKGAKTPFKTSPKPIPPIEILPDVSDSFAAKAIRQISEFPPKWLNEFKNNGCKIILSPSLNLAYKSQGVCDVTAKTLEKLRENASSDIILN